MKFLKLLTLIIVFSSLNTAFSQINVAANTLVTTGDPFPENGMCPVSGRTLQVKIVNNGTSILNVVSTPVTISVNITGPINQTFSAVLNSGSNISPGGSRYVNITTVADFSLKGTYSLALSATCTGDQSPGTDIVETLTVEGNKLTLTSAPTTSSQTVCLNSSISTITYSISGNATNATATGLPAGVTSSFNFPNLTISGTPTTLSGSPFSYSVTSSGICPNSENETLKGSMIVKALPTISIVDKTNDTLTCNDPLFIFNAIGGNSYSWSTGATTSNITVSTPGKYILTGTANGCSNKDSIDVKQNITPPNQPVGTDVSRCGPGTVNLGVTSDAKTTVIWYGSNLSTVVGAGLNYTTPSIIGTTLYYAEAKNTSTGCISSKTEVKAIIIPFNTAGTPSSTPTVCINSPITNITHTTTGASGIGAATGLPTGLTATFTGNATAGTITISGTPSIDGTFNYSIPLTGGCGSVNAIGTLSVKSLDNVSFTYPNNSFCLTDPNPSPVINGTVGGTFSSSPTGLSLNPSTGSINLNSSSAGTYEVKYTTNGQCPNVSTFPVSIGSNPAVNPVSDLSVCQGSIFNSINFTGTPGTVFQWTNSNPAIGLPANGIGNISSFQGTSIGSSVIVVTPKIGSCFGASKSFNLNINSPTLPTFTQLGPYCKDATADAFQTTSINGIAGTWNTTISTATVGTQTYTFTPTSTSAPTCATTTTTMTVTVNSPTIPTFTQVPAVCSGATISALPTTSNNGITGTWSPAINNTATTTYTFTPDAGQCATTTTMTVTVNTSSSISPISGNSDICQGSTSQLTNTTPGGVWSSSNTAVATVNSSGLVTAVSEGISTIKYDATGNSACSQSAEKPIRVTGLPLVNSVPDQQVCEGTSFNTINFSGTAGATFNWTNSDTKIGLNANGSGNINAFIAKGTTPGGSAFTSYITVTPVIGNCIGNNYILKLSVNPQEDATFSYNEDLFCKNQSDPTPTILGTKGGLFTAISSGLVVNDADGTILLKSSTPGKHSVMYKTSGKCSNSNSVAFEINPIPTVDSIPDYTICSGYFADSIKFKGTTGASFDWTNSNPNTVLISNGVNIIRPFDAVNNSATNQFSVVSVTPKFGKCLGATKKFNFIVRNTPRLVITQLDTVVCTGGNINFKTELTPAVTNPIYQWTVNGAKVGVNSSIYWSNALKNKDKITVNLTGKDFCPTSANLFVRMDSLRLSMQVPSMLYLKAPAINLVGYPVGGTFSGKGITNNKLDPSVAGVGNKMITYSFKNANNCVGKLTQKVVVYDTLVNNCHVTTYDTVKVNITDTVSILKFKFKLTTGIKANQETSMRVYPNPTSDILVVEAADEKALAGYRYKLLDAAGKEVYNQLVKSTITEISLKSLGAAGTYFFEVFDEKQQRLVTKKIILD